METTTTTTITSVSPTDPLQSTTTNNKTNNGDGKDDDDDDDDELLLLSLTPQWLNNPGFASALDRSKSHHSNYHHNSKQQQQQQQRGIGGIGGIGGIASSSSNRYHHATTTTTTATGGRIPGGRERSRTSFVAPSTASGSSALNSTTTSTTIPVGIQPSNARSTGSGNGPDATTPSSPTTATTITTTTTTTTSTTRPRRVQSHYESAGSGSKGRDYYQYRVMDEAEVNWDRWNHTQSRSHHHHHHHIQSKSGPVPSLPLDPDRDFPPLQSSSGNPPGGAGAGGSGGSSLSRASSSSDSTVPTAASSSSSCSSPLSNSIGNESVPPSKHATTTSSSSSSPSGTLPSFSEVIRAAAPETSKQDRDRLSPSESNPDITLESSMKDIPLPAQPCLPKSVAKSIMVSTGGSMSSNSTGRVRSKSYHQSHTQQCGPTLSKVAPSVTPNSSLKPARSRSFNNQNPPRSGESPSVASTLIVIEKNKSLKPSLTTLTTTTSSSPSPSPPPPPPPPDPSSSIFPLSSNMPTTASGPTPSLPLTASSSKSKLTTKKSKISLFQFLRQKNAIAESRKTSESVSMPPDPPSQRSIDNCSTPLTSSPIQIRSQDGTITNHASCSPDTCSHPPHPDTTVTPPETSRRRSVSIGPTITLSASPKFGSLRAPPIQPSPSLSSSPAPTPIGDVLSSSVPPSQQSLEIKQRPKSRSVSSYFTFNPKPLKDEEKLLRELGWVNPMDELGYSQNSPDFLDGDGSFETGDGWTDSDPMESTWQLTEAELRKFHEEQHQLALLESASSPNDVTLHESQPDSPSNSSAVAASVLSSSPPSSCSPTLSTTDISNPETSDQASVQKMMPAKRLVSVPDFSNFRFVLKNSLPSFYKGVASSKRLSTGIQSADFADSNVSNSPLHYGDTSSESSSSDDEND